MDRKSSEVLWSEFVDPPRHSRCFGARVGPVQFTDVADMARVKINGGDAGVLWKAPYRVSTSALRSGTNRIEVSVTSPWRNPLIAEARSSTGTLYPPMTGVFTDDAEILPAGLLGPMSLVYNHRP